MSLIIIIRSRGPRTVPWGTLDNTGAGSERAPFADTCWVRRVRKLRRMAPILPPILSFLILLQRMVWSTLSKALAKSRYIESTSWPDSIARITVSICPSNWDKVDLPFKKPC